jgi:hypothetical protein
MQTIGAPQLKGGEQLPRPIDAQRASFVSVKGRQFIAALAYCRHGRQE